MAKVPSSVQYIRDVFEETDIDKVWNELERRFHFNVKAWKKEFDVVLSNHDRFKDPQEVFLEYGKINIEPLLNTILKRNRYPTWINFVTYVLHEKIEKRKIVAKAYRNRYAGK